MDPARQAVLLPSGRRWFMAREVSIIGLDIVKTVFQIHGANRQGRAALRKGLQRGQLSEFFSRLKARTPPFVQVGIRFERRKGKASVPRRERVGNAACGQRRNASISSRFFREGSCTPFSQSQIVAGSTPSSCANCLCVSPRARRAARRRSRREVTGAEGS